jgi:hypothetical protein
MLVVQMQFYVYKVHVKPESAVPKLAWICIIQLRFPGLTLMLK